jgi:hypothetical protein
MLDRFQTLQNCVIKTLSALKSDIKFTDGELTILSETTKALQPVKVAIEKLCSREIELYSADITFQFMFDELAEQKTKISQELKTELLVRIKQRPTVWNLKSVA